MKFQVAALSLLTICSLAQANPGGIPARAHGVPFQPGRGQPLPPGRVYRPMPGNGNGRGEGRGRPFEGGEGRETGNSRGPWHPVPGRAYGYYGQDGRIAIREHDGSELDRFVAMKFIGYARFLSCDSMGNMLRQISNEILQAQQQPDDDDGRYESDPRMRERKQLAANMKRMMRSPQFAQIVMDRLSEMFKSCDKQCFDDGVAVGIISGTGYCNAAIAVQGLPDDGFKAQGQLPVCQTETFVGCQQGYTQAVNSVQGCLTYASGSFYAGFEHSVSQDCHIDMP